MKNLLDVTGRVAIITGGGTGVGAGIARVFAEHGANIVVAGRNLDRLKAVANDLAEATGRRILPIKADVREEEDVVNLAAKTAAEFGRIDILVNNAGGTRGGNLEDTTGDGWDRVLALNLKGPFMCTREVGKHMIKQRKGAIINISSISGVIGVRGVTAYSAAKAGLQNFTQITALEWGKHNIRSNCVALGFIQHDRVRWADRPGDMESIEAAVPLGRTGKPEEVGAVALFLASDASSYVSGVTFLCAGGLLYPGGVGGADSAGNVRLEG